MCDLKYLFYVNMLTFVLYAIDKYWARNGKWRIPEVLLMGFALLGGAFGALCAIIFYNHKTRNYLFKIGIPLLLYMQLAVEILYRMEIIHF